MELTKTSVLISIGEELGKLLSKKIWKVDHFRKLWEFSYSKKQLLAQGVLSGREIRLIIIGAFSIFSKKEYEITKNFILAIINTIQDWETCDQLALKVLVNLAIQNQQEIFSILKEWMHSDNKWIRRLAVATIPPYIRAKKDKAKICLEISNDIMKDKDKDVKKAIGWALREISKKDAEAVFDFLKKWSLTKDKNTHQIIKEGMKKLSKEKQKKLKYLISE